MSYRKHTDFVSDAALQAREQALVVTSGDGTLSVHDLRTCKFRSVEGWLLGQAGVVRVGL